MRVTATWFAAWMSLTAFAVAGGLKFEVLTEQQTGIQPALEAWQAQETELQGGTLKQWSMWGVCLFDQNMDGRLDLLITSHNAPGSIVLRHGDEPFRYSDVTRELGVTSRDLPKEHKPLILDIDKNGFPDIIPHTTQNQTLILNDGRRLTKGAAVRNLLPVRYGLTLDLDNDGFPDFRRFRREKGRTLVEDARNTFGDKPPGRTFDIRKYQQPDPKDLPADIVTELAELRANPAKAGSYHSPWYQAVDLDGDGDEDLIMQFTGSYGGERFARYCIRDASGKLENKTAELGIPEGLVPILPARDISGDQRVDVFTTVGPGAGLYVQNKDGTFTLASNPTLSKLMVAPGTLLAQIEYHDLDNDGDDDIVIGTTTKGVLHVYENLGNGVIENRLIANHYTAEGYDLGDIDGDGRIDIAAGGPVFNAKWNPSRTTSTEFTIYRNVTETAKAAAKK